MSFLFNNIYTQIFTDLWHVEKEKFAFTHLKSDADLKSIGETSNVDFSKHNFYFASVNDASKECLKPTANIILENVVRMELYTLRLVVHSWLCTGIAKYAFVGDNTMHYPMQSLAFLQPQAMCMHGEILPTQSFSCIIIDISCY